MSVGTVDWARLRNAADASSWRMFRYPTRPVTDQHSSLMARGVVYLAAATDWFSRRALSRRLSITMEAAFCVDALEEAFGSAWQARDLQYGSRFAIHRGCVHGRSPEGGHSQSMEGKDPWRDNVFVERLWQSIKDEEI